MSAPREIELKFEVPTESLPSLSRGPLLKGVHSSGHKPARLVSVYFDTKKLKLRRKALSLRIRRVGGKRDLPHLFATNGSMISALNSPILRFSETRHLDFY